MSNFTDKLMNWWTDGASRMRASLCLLLSDYRL